MAKRSQDAEQTVEEQVKTINDEQLSKYLGEKVEDGKVVEPEESPKEVKKTKEPQENKTEAPVKEKVTEKPDINIDEIKEEVKKTVSKEMADRITEALGGEKATKAEKDKYQAIAEEFYEKNGRNPTWHELIPFIVEEAKTSLKQEQEMKAKEEEDRQKQMKEYQKQQTDKFNKDIDDQLNDLYASNKLPQIKDPNDPNDLGVVARRALFQKMMEVNQGRVKDGKSPIYSLKEIFYEHYTPPNRQPAGADAPISIGRGGSAPKSEGDYSYGEIHGAKSFIDMYHK